MDCFNPILVRFQHVHEFPPVAAGDLLFQSHIGPISTGLPPGIESQVMVLTFNPILVRFQPAADRHPGVAGAGLISFNPILVRFQRPRGGGPRRAGQFQSHIGPISTRRWRRCYGACATATSSSCFVSIPYWSDFNGLRPVRFSLCFSVSIPYWSDFNRRTCRTPSRSCTGFNPILVRFQPARWGRAGRDTRVQFQSHIGPISTWCDERAVRLCAHSFNPILVRFQR